MKAADFHLPSNWINESLFSSLLELLLSRLRYESCVRHSGWHQLQLVLGLSAGGSPSRLSLAVHRSPRGKAVLTLGGGGGGGGGGAYAKIVEHGGDRAWCSMGAAEINVTTYTKRVCLRAS